MLAQSGERQRSGKRRLREGKRGRQRTGIAREGFLDRRSKRCFWLLLSPQTKVARAGARNYPQRRQIMRSRRCAATPHPSRLRRAICLPAGRSAGLTRHRRVIQHREPLKGKANGGVSFNTAKPSRGRLGRCGGRSEKRLLWLKQAAASASAPVNAGTVLLTDNGDERLCPREYAANHCRV